MRKYSSSVFILSSPIHPKAFIYISLTENKPLSYKLIIICENCDICQSPFSTIGLKNIFISLIQFNFSICNVTTLSWHFLIEILQSFIGGICNNGWFSNVTYVHKIKWEIIISFWVFEWKKYEKLRDEVNYYYYFKRIYHNFLFSWYNEKSIVKRTDFCMVFKYWKKIWDEWRRQLIFLWLLALYCISYKKMNGYYYWFWHWEVFISCHKSGDIREKIVLKLNLNLILAR